MSVRALLMLALLALFPACQHTRFQVDRLPAGQYGSYERGVTTYGEVLSALGPPAFIQPTSRGFLFRYETLKSDEWLGTLNYRQAKASYSFGDAERLRLVMFFDHDGRFLYWRMETHFLDTGWGGVIGHNRIEEPFFERRAFDAARRPENRWGAADLNQTRLYRLNPPRNPQRQAPRDRGDFDSDG